MSKIKKKAKLAIVMTGGGARAAYQVGVLKAIAEMLPQGSPSPFTIICGTSAGAINAASLAAKSDHFKHSVRRLHFVWSNFSCDQIFRTDVLGIIKTGAHWLLSMAMGGLGKHNPIYLLDRTPLRKLLEQYIDSGVFQSAIDKKSLHALSINATGYSSHQSVAFYHGHSSLKNWKRAQRIGVSTRITVDHLMASSAIPFLFSPVKLNREFFSDGSIRQTAPISPALHLGADRVLIIGNHQSEPKLERISNANPPTLGEIAGHTLNSIFLDSLDADIERLQRINKTVKLIDDQDREKHGVTLRQVEVQVVSPSEDIGKMAAAHAHELPWSIKSLLRGIGAYSKTDSNLMSYLLFEKGYCNALIKLGYEDTQREKENILYFLRD
ncbi:MAG: patatin-like phospholipase family protein [Gammaproteobacteria bacterium]|nr:patatin-like phospholipase family protein [Gammaproteobacteria bacterium]MCW9031169.1 patatin-like phospholipase family protein [Gammaproteobacteria bacterium]